MKYPHEVVKRVRAIGYSEIKISSIVIAEMEYGAAKSSKREANRSVMLDFLAPFEIIPFDEQDAELFGLIRAELERRGEPIGPYDMMLAAQALRWDYTFVTNNMREFQRVKGLKLENWV
jgi:tRNA(fMet)-specific endonuclease VapC